MLKITRNNAAYKNIHPGSMRSGFTLIEIMCTISIFFIAIAGIFTIHTAYTEKEKILRTRAEMSTIGAMLEDYYTLHGDYPKIIAHNDSQGNILCAALHGNIDPNGNTPLLEKKIDLVTTSLSEINQRFVDPFLSDYIYYYKLRPDTGTWQNPSYILISKGPKGQQKPDRISTITKSVTVTPEGDVTGEFQGNIVLTSGGFL